MNPRSTAFSKLLSSHAHQPIHLPNDTDAGISLDLSRQAKLATNFDGVCDVQAVKEFGCYVRPDTLVDHEDAATGDGAVCVPCARGVGPRVVEVRARDLQRVEV